MVIQHYALGCFTQHKFQCAHTFHFSLLIDSAMISDNAKNCRWLWSESEATPVDFYPNLVARFISDFGVAPPCMMSPVTAFKRMKCKIYILLIHLLQSMTFLFLVLLLVQLVRLDHLFVLMKTCDFFSFNPEVVLTQPVSFKMSAKLSSLSGTVTPSN